MEYSVSDKPFNIVLVRPEIPQNTGNIGRLCVNTSARLHLIRPLGFSLEEKHLKRAGMDYWNKIDLHLYDDWSDFLSRNPKAELYFFSTKTDKIYWECPYNDGAFLVFGNEGHGLPEEFYSEYSQRLYTIPMPGAMTRSLNLANSTAIVLYEGLRRQMTAGQ